VLWQSHDSVHASVYPLGSISQKLSLSLDENLATPKTLNSINAKLALIQVFGWQQAQSAPLNWRLQASAHTIRVTDQHYNWGQIIYGSRFREPWAKLGQPTMASLWECHSAEFLMGLL
jgi:hypothetical protein